jgi:hypothetical protein
MSPGTDGISPAAGEGCGPGTDGMSPARVVIERKQPRAIAAAKRFMMFSFDDARFLTSNRIKQLREILASTASCT